MRSSLLGSRRFGFGHDQPSNRRFSPLSLFAAGEQGAWYDPSDFSTMFQDSAGTTPVTAAGQPVGLILDKSGRANHASQANGAQCPILSQDTGGRYFLLFDGVDDGMATAAFTPGSDKLQLFAGARKLSDAATGMIVELGASASSNVASFFLAGPRTALANYGFRSQGSLFAVGVDASPYVAPISNVVTGIGDIAADTCIIRVNGTQIASGVNDQGTGNYGTYPLYIGRRGGTVNPFNGRLYSMIIRFGSSLAATTIAQAESWVNAKTGAY